MVDFIKKKSYHKFVVALKASVFLPFLWFYITGFVIGKCLVLIFPSYFKYFYYRFLLFCTLQSKAKTMVELQNL